MKNPMKVPNEKLNKSSEWKIQCKFQMKNRIKVPMNVLMEVPNEKSNKSSEWKIRWKFQMKNWIKVPNEKSDESSDEGSK